MVGGIFSRGAPYFLVQWGRLSLLGSCRAPHKRSGSIFIIITIVSFLILAYSMPGSLEDSLFDDRVEVFCQGVCSLSASESWSDLGYFSGCQWKPRATCTAMILFVLPWCWRRSWCNFDRIWLSEAHPATFLGIQIKQRIHLLGLLRRLPKAKAVESYLELLNLEPLRPRVHDSWHGVKDREWKSFCGRVS